jgi:hypothetical protein
MAEVLEERMKPLDVAKVPVAMLGLSSRSPDEAPVGLRLWRMALLRDMMAGSPRRGIRVRIFRFYMA